MGLKDDAAFAVRGVFKVLVCFIIALFSVAGILSMFNKPQVNKVDSIPHSYQGGSNLCLEKIKEGLNYPSTIDVHWSESFENVLPNGHKEIGLSFSTKNAFGMKVEYKSVCIIKIDGHVSVKIF